MNIKITKSEHQRLLEHQVHEYIIGSHLYKTNHNKSDKDLVCIYDDFLLKNKAFHLNTFPNIHSFQYDDLDQNVQYIWTSNTQFWQNQRSGEVTINSDIVMFYPAFKNPLELCRTYKVIRAYLGYAKRDLKQIKKKNKLFHAKRGLYCAEQLLNNQLPNLDFISQISKESNDANKQLQQLRELEKKLRLECNKMYDAGELKLYHIPNVKDSLAEKILQANNVKEFRY